MPKAVNRLSRIAGLDILPVKPYQGWNDLQLDEALRRPELFRGDLELYAAVRREAVKRGLGGEEDYTDSPFPPTDTNELRRKGAGEKLPFLLRDETRKEKHKRKERKAKLRELLMETTKLSEPKERKADALDRLLRLAAVVEDGGGDMAALDRQVDLYLRRSIERQAHFVPSKETNTPPMWRPNMDYAPEENSPYFGSVSEFMKQFPGGIGEWRKWRERSRKQRERRWRIASLMPDTQAADDGLEAFLKEAWVLEAERRDMATVAHFVPEGGDDVAELGDKEPKIWSDDPKWKSIGEFLKAHREHFGQDADDAALTAARDFVKYWKLTTRKPKGPRSK